MTQNKHFKKQIAFTLLGLLCTFGMGQAAADTLQAVVQSFKASTTLQTGMIVQLTGKDSSQVQADTIASARNMSGVVVSQSDAPVTLSPANGTTQQVYVATSGRYDVLVSSQDGPIAPGDYVTISSLAGVGMKADDYATEVVGKAASGFDGTHGVESNVTVRDQQGKQIKVALGRIPVDLAISPNPNQRTSNVPGFLASATRVVTTKPVAAWRIYIGVLILLGTLIVGGSLLYGGVRNGMIAIGRNPLARSSITRNLIQVVIISIIIFVSGLFAVYLVLKL